MNKFAQYYAAGQERAFSDLGLIKISARALLPGENRPFMDLIKKWQTKAPAVKATEKAVKAPAKALKANPPAPLEGATDIHLTQTPDGENVMKYTKPEKRRYGT